MKRRNRHEQGFTLLEAVVVIGIMFTLAGIAVVKSFGSMEAYQANSGQDIVAGQLRVARQLAISQRRYVKVAFNTASNPMTVSYQVQPRPGSADPAQAWVTSTLPRQVSFMQESGVPDTPMAFGTCSGAGVCIASVGGGPAIMYFNASGQFTDSTAINPINGTVFLGITNQVNTARAVTIMGATGRVRPYTYVGGSSSLTSWNE